MRYTVTPAAARRHAAHLLRAADSRAGYAFREPLAARIPALAEAMEALACEMLEQARTLTELGLDADAADIARRAYRLGAERRIVARRAAEAVAGGHRLVVGPEHGRKEAC